MRGLGLLPTAHPLEVSTHPELAELRIEINETWPSLPQPLLLEWIETPLVSTDASGVPWLIGPAERDPLRGSRGRTVIPRTQRAKLKRIAELGVPFKRLAIAHELDYEGPVRQLLPALRKGPQPCTGFAMLAGLAPLTDGFTSANKLELPLIIVPVSSPSSPSQVHSPPYSCSPSPLSSWAPDSDCL
jgi:hypothetical protein